ncbi:MAG: efflux RND transporter periplasmic adaptor subunit [Gammaproteobacteria bacterium]
MTTWNSLRKPIAIASVLVLIGVVLYNLSRQLHETAVVQSIGKTIPAGPFLIQAALDPERPRVGNNRLTLMIRAINNQPVSDAAVTAIAEMPAMGSMPAMHVPIEMSGKRPGWYEGQFELPMTGAWPLTITVESASYGNVRVDFDMGTGRKGLAATFSSSNPDVGSEGSEATISAPYEPIVVDAYRRQLIGVATGVAERRKIVKTIRAAARIALDETRFADISLKFDGWIGRLNADYLGRQVLKGHPLFTVYSPELVSAQDEYLDSVRRGRTLQNDLKAASIRRLTLWGVDQSQIRALEDRGQPSEYFPFLSPVTGTIIEKNVVPGSAFKAGSRLLRLADLSTVWVEARVYESDLPWIKAGMEAQIILEDDPSRAWSGKVDFIEPILDTESRTARVRVELPNPGGSLRPDRYARMNLLADLGERLVVPEQAVLYSGENRVVFLDLGNGRLQAKKIKTGVRNDDFIEVLEGLNDGDAIVVSGNFLIASESKLKAGVKQW